jgi:uncharacterized OB-fold protein
MSGLPIVRCCKCGTAAFPAQVWCSNCRANDWASELATTGVIAEITVVRAAVGASTSEPVAIASVVLDSGPPVVARLNGTAEPGDVAEITVRDGGPHARRATTS